MQPRKCRKQLNMTSDTNIIDGPDILPLEEVMATYNANNGVQIANDSPDSC